jgi:hypothetical protein
MSANRVARWDPLTSTWSALGNGINTWVAALVVDGSGNLYAGGEFTTAGGAVIEFLARWDGAAWEVPFDTTGGRGVTGMIIALAFDSSGNLYAGGEFTAAGGVSVN